MSKILEKPIKVIGKILSKIEYLFSENEEFQLTMIKHGWFLDDLEETEFNEIIETFDLLKKIPTVKENIDKLINGINLDSVEVLKAILENCRAVFQQIQDIRDLDNLQLPSPFNTNNFWQEFPEQLVDTLFIEHLEVESPLLYSFLHFLQVISYEDINQQNPQRISYTRKELNWNRLSDFLRDKEQHFSTVYNWNVQNEDIDYELLLNTIENIFLAIRLQPINTPPRERFRNTFLNDDDVLIRTVNELELPFIKGTSPTEHVYWNLGVTLLPIAETLKSNTPIRGVAVIPTLQGELNTEIWVSPSTYFKIDTSLEDDTSAYLSILPNRISFVSNLSESTISSSIHFYGKPQSPYILIGAPSLSRLEVEGFKIALDIQGDINDPEVKFLIGTGERSLGDDRPKIRFVVETRQGDQFVSKILQYKKIEFEYAGTFEWSSKTGIHFENSGSLSYVKAIHKSLGPLSFTNIYFDIIGDNDLHLQLGSGIRSKLGPVGLKIEKMGLEASLITLDPNDPSFPGLLGKNDIKFGFKPPSGVGISIDTNAVKGGGYLYFNYKEGRYAGVAGLSLKNKIQLSAFGLINTKLPDGKKGFSFLLFISAEFSPIQIGMGFTLNGVGGLIGIHRTVMIDTFRAGVRTGAYDRLLFPSNPVEDAIEIIGDLRAIFPPEEGRHVFGIMGKLGWGSPTLLTAEIGIIIEVPSPVRLAILGVLNCVLPSPTKRLLVLNVNFLGVIDFGKKQLSFDATIYDSSLLKKFTLSGDMALRVSWGSQKNFLLSVGGFHPSFQPPPQLISMRRLTLSLLGGNNPRLTLTTYFAVTSNTVQFGARADVFVKVTKKLSVEGYLGFDVLFQFNPFYFHILVYAYFGVKWKGKEKFSISVHISLEGPRPWKIDGHAQIKVVGIKFKVKIKKTWGKRENTSLPSVEVSIQLDAALRLSQNWTVQLPASSANLVQTRKLQVADDVILLHPIGTLQISQKVLPLNLNIELFGTQRASDGGVYQISELNIGDKSTLPYEYIKEEFAPAQFRSMSQAQKLSSPSFVKYDNGIKVKEGIGLVGDGVTTKEVAYETIILGAEPLTPPSDGSKLMTKESPAVMEAMVRGGVSGRANLSQSKRQAPLGPKSVMIHEEKYGVVWKEDLQLLDPNALCSSYAEAIDYYANHIADNIDDKSKLKILPEFEIL